MCICILIHLIPGVGHGNLLQDSCLENPMDRGAWWDTVHGVTKSRTWLKHLGTRAHTCICVPDSLRCTPETNTAWRIYWKWKALSCVRLFATPWTIQSMEFSRPEYWCGKLFPSPGDLPNQQIKPRSPALQADSLLAKPQGKPKNTVVGSLLLLQQIFPTQKSNQGLPHCRRILYQLSYQVTE